MLYDSPFTPAHPATPELFTGREGLVQEIRQLAWRCFNKKHVEIAFFSGEHGVGKSSLARKICHDLEKHGLEKKNESKFLSVEVKLCGINAIEQAFILTHNTLVRKKQDGKSKTDFKIGINAGPFKAQWARKSEDLDRETQGVNFAETLATLAKKIDKKSTGVVVFWDDISGFVKSSDFLFWLKRFAESNAGVPILLIMTCSEKDRKEINEQNFFAKRFFSVTLNATDWSFNDTKCFLCAALKSKLSKDSHEKLGQSSLPENLIPEKALETFSQACIGAPVFAQKIGDAIWQALPKLMNVKEENKKNMSKVYDEVAKNIGNYRLGKEIVSSIDSKSYILLLGLLHNLSMSGGFFLKTVLSNLPNLPNLPKDVSQSKAKEFFKCMQESGALIAFESPRHMYQLRVV